MSDDVWGKSDSQMDEGPFHGEDEWRSFTDAQSGEKFELNSATSEVRWLGNVGIGGGGLAGGRHFGRRANPARGSRLQSGPTPRALTPLKTDESGARQRAASVTVGSDSDSSVGSEEEEGSSTEARWKRRQRLDQTERSNARAALWETSEREMLPLGTLQRSQQWDIPRERQRHRHQLLVQQSLVDSHSPPVPSWHSSRHGDLRRQRAEREQQDAIQREASRLAQHRRAAGRRGKGANSFQAPGEESLRRKGADRRRQRWRAQVECDRALGATVADKILGLKREDLDATWERRRKVVYVGGFRRSP
jgi:hypothetical protein